MSSYVTSIGAAFLFFPLIAFFLTVPYVFYQYHKYGAIPVLRTMIVYSFVLYLLCIYFLVILPLPSIDKVASLTTPYTQLVPFRFVTDFLKESGFVWNQVGTYLSAIKDPSFYNVFFNILMFLPLGIYLRYYFKCGIGKTILISFGVSLFFELTQLSGLYGIYPRPYRLFDVDDLMMNTLGGLLGGLMAPLLSFLPSRDRLDEISYDRGQMVSFYRRFTALMFDWFFLMVCNSFLSLKGNSLLLLYLGYFILLSYFGHGRTLGKRLVRIKVVTEDQKKASLGHYIVRYGILYGIILYAPIWIIQLLSLINLVPAFCLIPIFVVCLIFLFFYLQFLLECLRSMLFSKKCLSYERISKTRIASTIRVKEQEKKTESVLV